MKMGSISLDNFSNDEIGLWRDYFSSNSEKYRNQLIDRYMFLADKIAAYYFKRRIGGNVEYSDYQHLAVIGLIQAIENYRVHYGAKFETYASFRIKGSILNSIKYFSEKDSYIDHNKKRKQELADSVCDLSDDNENIFQKIINATLALTYSELLDQTYVYQDQHEVTEKTYDTYTHCELDDIKRLLHNLLEHLPDDEQVITRYYYYYELSFSQIAEIMGITKGRVSQIHKNAMNSIRELYIKSQNFSQLG